MLNPRISSSLLCTVLVLAGCAERAPETPSDPYDPSRIELRSPPATVTSERHTGAFAAGRRSA